MANKEKSISFSPKKEIRYTDYFKDRLRLRSIPADIPEKVLRNPQERYQDQRTGREIAVKKVKITRTQARLFMIAYEEYSDHMLAITIHGISKRQIRWRLKTGRWVPR